MITDMDDDISDEESYGGSDNGIIHDSHDMGLSTGGEGVPDWKDDIGKVQTVPV